MQLVKLRTNRSIFVPFDYGSPADGLFTHISGLGQLARLDFERFDVAGEVIFKIEGDVVPASQQDEEARIGTLAYALKKLGNAVDTAEFIRCLNAICDGGDARYRQSVASHYYREIDRRGTSAVLKEMALLAMQLGRLNDPDSAILDEDAIELNSPENTRSDESPAQSSERKARKRLSLFDREVEAATRLIRGGRRCSGFVHDDHTGWINDLDANGASIEELDAAFETLDAMDQYDENGAIIVMSSFERTTACGKLDPEFVEEDLPERARHLAGDLRRAYANGVEIEAIWDDIRVQLDVIFPIKGKTNGGGRFYSHANRELQNLTREILEMILSDCKSDFHLNALRMNKSYRAFHKAIRATSDIREVGEIMRRAYEAKESGVLPLKHFTTLNTAAQLQRERLKSRPLSKTARALLKDIARASNGKLKRLRWEMYGNNQPQHPIHQLFGQEKQRIWDALKAMPEDPAVATLSVDFTVRASDRTKIKAESRSRL